jgi:hypothetical protein
LAVVFYALPVVVCGAWTLLQSMRKRRRKSSSP